MAYGGQVQGTYLHGVFDNLEWTRQYLNELRLAKGLEPLEGQLISIKDFKDREYDKLADVLRQSLDMEQIYQIHQQRRKNENLYENTVTRALHGSTVGIEYPMTHIRVEAYGTMV